MYHTAVSNAGLRYQVCFGMERLFVNYSTTKSWGVALVVVVSWWEQRRCWVGAELPHTAWWLSGHPSQPGIPPTYFVYQSKHHHHSVTILSFLVPLNILWRTISPFCLLSHLKGYTICLWLYFYSSAKISLRSPLCGIYMCGHLYSFQARTWHKSLQLLSQIWITIFNLYSALRPLFKKRVKIEIIWLWIQVVASCCTDFRSYFHKFFERTCQST